MKEKIFFSILIGLSLCGCADNINKPLNVPAANADNNKTSNNIIVMADPLDTQLKLYPVEYTPILHTQNTTNNTTDADVFKPTELSSPKDIIKANEFIPDTKAPEEFKKSIPEPIIKSIKKIEFYPTLSSKDNRCSNGEIVTLMKDGTYACCPKDGKVCYPLLKSGIVAPPAPIIQSINKKPQCAKGETLIKMTSGEFACCPNNENVCYPVLE